MKAPDGFPFPVAEANAERLAALRYLGAASLATAGLAIVAFPILVHVLSPALAIGVTVIVALGVYLVCPSAMVVSVFFGAMFQNLFVSLASPDLTVGTNFDLARGYNFVLLAMVWGLARVDHLTKNRLVSAEFRRLLLYTDVALSLIGIYLVVGVFGSPTSAFISLRNVATGLLMFQVCLIVARHHPVRVGTVLAIAAGLFLVLGYFELFYRETWLQWTNGYAFWNLSRANEIAAGLWDQQAKSGGIVVTGLRDSFKITLFNTPLLADLNIKVERLFGPNMQPISYAYALAFLTLYGLFTQRFVLGFLLAPLLLLANAKGAVIVVLLSTLAWFMSWLFGSRLAFFCLFALLIVYVVVGIFLGLQIGDFHVLGLMGGLYNFLEQPFGHGLGSGGNFDVDFTSLDWSAIQAAGRTPVAIESAIGVLLFQMGIAAFVVLACYVWLAWTVVMMGRQTGHPLQLVAGFSLLVIVFNGFFQEEALFSPLACGVTMALCGLIAGNVLKQKDA